MIVLASQSRTRFFRRKFASRLRWVGASFLLLAPHILTAQTLDSASAARFLGHLLWQRDSLGMWFDPADLHLTQRLGIVYDGVDWKNLIGNDLDDSLKAYVRDHPGMVHITARGATGDITVAEVTFDDVPRPQEFLFQGRSCRPRLLLHSARWATVESRHFRFVLRDRARLNIYCVERLEHFLEHMAGVLQFTRDDLRLLAHRKILYFLCEDEAEMEDLTGHRARGLADLACDAIVSTYPTHFHELTHLLINFKLRHLPLYAHPFLQEGFAVAYGGRGGMSSEVLIPLGSFLFDSKFVALEELRDRRSFSALDPSLSYPAAGLYNRFLVETAGIARYLELYRSHCGFPDGAATTTLSSAEAGDNVSWAAYLRTARETRSILLEDGPAPGRVLVVSDSCTITEDSAWYHFRIAGPLLVPSRTGIGGEGGSLFRETFPTRPYRGEKYLVRASQEEVGIYNLPTNTLVASYARGFALPPVPVSRWGDRWAFKVRKRVFEDPLRSVLHGTNRKTKEGEAPK